jgi:hypothetical protein
MKTILGRPLKFSFFFFREKYFLEDLKVLMYFIHLFLYRHYSKNSPSQKGKSRLVAPDFRSAETRVHDDEDDDNMSDNWDKEEMRIAFVNSKQRCAISDLS